MGLGSAGVQHAEQMNGVRTTTTTYKRATVNKKVACISHFVALSLECEWGGSKPCSTDGHSLDNSGRNIFAEVTSTYVQLKQQRRAIPILSMY